MLVDVEDYVSKVDVDEVSAGRGNRPRRVRFPRVAAHIGSLAPKCSNASEPYFQALERPRLMESKMSSVARWRM